MIVCLGLPCFAGDKSGQLSSYEKAVMQQMLKDTADAVRKNYYDPSLHGVDFTAAYQVADQEIRNATSVHQGYEAIESMLAKLDDSHTHFIPPAQPFKVEQGWEMQMIGDKCLVTHITDGSDAAAQGLKAGDRILVVDGVKPSREGWAGLHYQLRTLSPRSSLHLVVGAPGEQPKNMVVASKVIPRPAEYDLTTNDIWRLHELQQADWRQKYEPRGVELDNVFVWKLPIFYLKEADVDSYFHKAQKYPALVLDLRGNPGGAAAILLRVVGMVFDHDVKIADDVKRDKTKALVAKSQGDHAYKGKLIVLIDSESASSSELFARTVQLEKRGTVIGDQSAGAVRGAERFRVVHGDGMGNHYIFAVEVTVADVKMPDGKALEKNGVVPDENVLPSPEELAAGADPQLARALQLAGSPTSAQKAGALFPPVKQ
ncbi:MAG: S41 family peptidase [Candidatus Korobacteraceae bacterium]|jgi:carboxyl-terminal processing protease